MLKTYYRNIKENKFQTLEKFRIGSWLYLENPTAQELEYIIDKFELEEGHIKDALDIFEAPRLELEEKDVYFFARFPYLENSRIVTAPILVILGEYFIITIAPVPLPNLNKLLEGKINLYTTQKIKLFLQLISHINSIYNSHLTTINKQIRTFGVNLENIENKDIIQFVHYESILNDFLGNLVPTNTTLNKLLSGKYIKLYEEDRDLVEDLMLSNNQLIELSKSLLKNLVNIREAYSTIMTNNLNRVIKLFTSLTVVLTIPTMIASIYGMNVKLPFDQHPLAFSGIIFTVLIITFILLIIFIKRRWL